MLKVLKQEDAQKQPAQVVLEDTEAEGMVMDDSLDKTREMIPSSQLQHQRKVPESSSSSFR